MTTNKMPTVLSRDEARRLRKLNHTFNFEAIKLNFGIWPVVGVIVMGIGISTAFSLRTLFKAPDVTLDPWKNMNPHDRYENKQFKFLNPEKFDYENYIHPRPRF